MAQSILNTVQAMSSKRPQLAYLRDEFHLLTLNATVQRARIYAEGVDEDAREVFRTSLRRYLDDASRAYARPVNDRAHVRSIERLADALSKRHRAILRDGRFRIGAAQKALNLFLKYLWCVGWIAEPPHCPFDARVIALLPSDVRVRWTELDSTDSYVRLVSAARELARGKSLPTWELTAYNAVSNASRRAT